MAGRKLEAFSDLWSDTWLGKGINYFKYDKAFFRQEDATFKKNFDVPAQFKFLSENGLHLGDINTIRDAKSYEHTLDLAAMIKDERRRDYNIANALTDEEQFYSSPATRLADIDVILGVVLVLLLLNWLLALKRQHYK